MKTPAKINLHLKILKRNENNYHLIESVFIPIHKLSDVLECRIKFDNSFNCKISYTGIFMPDLPKENENILYKIWLLFLSITNNNFSIDISLQKNIPIGSGLGGGSSDAAKLILFLFQFCNDSEKNNIIKKIPSIGADITFFLNPQPALVTGIGENVKVLKNFSYPKNLLLISPNFSISAAHAYALFRKQNDFANQGNNALQRPILKKFLALNVLEKLLTQNFNCKNFTISGSGSSFFVTIDNKKIIEKIKQRFPFFYINFLEF